MKFEILMDSRENPKKCTILPLRQRKDFSIKYFHEKKSTAPAFTADLLLHINGDDLSTLTLGTPVQSIGLIDCNWRKLGKLLPKINPLPKLISIPKGFKTAYPRRNKLGNDPSEGLATIEALFICAAFLGKWDETLLEKYYFKNQFLEINQEEWKRYKLGPHR